MTFISELKKPFNTITLLLAVLGIGLSIIFYLNGKKEKKISYLLNEPTSLIFDNQNSSPKLRLYEQDSIPVIGNVYLLTGAIWNSGDFPITNEDIRVSVSLDLKESNRILDFKIIKQKDSSISKFNFQKIKNNSLQLTWKYFDPKFGFTFQIIYVGISDPQFQLSGKILDISSFSKVEKIENKRDTWISLIVGPIAIVLISIVLYVEKRKTGKVDIFPVIIGILLLLLLIIVFWISFFHETKAPV
jgi:hypothetical protein